MIKEEVKYILKDGDWKGLCPYLREKGFEIPDKNQGEITDGEIEIYHGLFTLPLRNLKTNGSLHVKGDSRLDQVVFEYYLNQSKMVVPTRQESKV